MRHNLRMYEQCSRSVATQFAILKVDCVKVRQNVVEDRRLDAEH